MWMSINFVWLISLAASFISASYLEGIVFECELQKSAVNNVGGNKYQQA